MRLQACRSRPEYVSNKTQATGLSSKAGGLSWATLAQHLLSNTPIRAVTSSPQERRRWGGRERPECSPNGMSLHMEGNISTGEEVNLLNRFEAPGGRQSWSFVPLCIPQNTLHSAVLQQMPNKYCIKEWCQEHSVCVVWVFPSFKTQFKILLLREVFSFFFF